VIQLQNGTIDNIKKSKKAAKARVPGAQKNTWWKECFEKKEA